MLPGHGLGWINSHLILGLIYLVVLQPIAIAMRLLGHDLRRSFAIARQLPRKLHRQDS